MAHESVFFTKDWTFNKTNTKYLCSDGYTVKVLGWGRGYIGYWFHFVRPSVRPPAYRDNEGMHHGTRETSLWERVYKPPY